MSDNLILLVLLFGVVVLAAEAQRKADNVFSIVVLGIAGFAATVSIVDLIGRLLP